MWAEPLVIGFGNVGRRDDGMRFVVLSTLCHQLGRPPMDADKDGSGDLGHELDTLLLHQLAPELADTLAPYDLVVFVDAHVGAILEPIRQEQLTACYRSAIVSHQLHPCAVLVVAQEMRGRHPRGVLLSLRGYNFGFGEGPSKQTAALVPEAVERVLAPAAGGD